MARGNDRETMAPQAGLVPRAHAASRMSQGRKSSPTTFIAFRGPEAYRNSCGTLRRRPAGSRLGLGPTVRLLHRRSAPLGRLAPALSLLLGLCALFPLRDSRLKPCRCGRCRSDGLRWILRSELLAAGCRRAGLGNGRFHCGSGRDGDRRTSAYPSRSSRRRDQRRRGGDLRSRRVDRPRNRQRILLRRCRR